ncbi:rhodanese-like domain-containing protein [Roseobacter ponti]|uniref:Rhodanese-like domain-containing protein n=2 Tax=Roseobacter ponti TaxID=1891787 RepID=A0A858SX24_9RHOB|nr:rhodanese-like domain-containing protein [Roseobacter ponti]
MSLSDPEKDGQQKAPSRKTRRGFMVLSLGALAGGGVLAAGWFNVFAENDGNALSPGEAHDLAARGDILLVDIRRPDEWVRTGVGEGALPIDMRRADFIDELLVRTGGRTDVPVALICARGVRSRRLSARLESAGFTEIRDVPEGMLGSGAGPGWLDRGLPVTVRQ